MHLAIMFFSDVIHKRSVFHLITAIFYLSLNILIKTSIFSKEISKYYTEGSSGGGGDTQTSKTYRVGSIFQSK
jgi:hypothetical protein